MKMTAKQYKSTVKKKRVDREGPIHTAIYNYLCREFPDSIVVHCKNEVKKSGVQFAIEIGKAKKMGLVVGWPDLMVIRPFPDRPLFIEVKAPKGSMSVAQRGVHAQLEGMGHRIGVARSVDDAQALVKSWR